jgi:hypothetical protein
MISAAKSEDGGKKVEFLRLTRGALQALDQQAAQKRKKFTSSVSQWSGNSDDEGSVNSGMLDEDICYECGLDTTGESDWSKLLICEKCDGEYHLKCVNLENVPRHRFICPRCLQEEDAFRGLKYQVGCNEFKARKQRGSVPSYVYSPSRPIDAAWEECQKKGYMSVSRVFPLDVVKALTHGYIEQRTQYGRVAQKWTGAVSEITEKMKKDCQNVVIRGGRFDIRVPDFVVEELRLNELLSPIMDRLRTIMGFPEPEIRTHNIVFAPQGEGFWSELLALSMYVYICFRIM